MANKRLKEVQFVLKDEDYEAFGRYRIMYTDQGHKMVSRQRMTYLVTAAMIALLFTVFHVDSSFTKLMYVIAAALAVVGIFLAEKLVLRQQEKVIKDSQNSAERVHQTVNKIRFDNDTFTTSAGTDEQTFQYKDIKLIDLTDCAIYVWMSDSVIMPLPVHAFRNEAEMKEVYKWIKAKITEQGGTVGQETKEEKTKK